MNRQARESELIVAKSIEAVLCDFDGVIRIYDMSPLAELERLHGLADGTTFDIAFTPSRLNALITGSLDREAWRSETVTDLERKTGNAGLAATLSSAMVDAPYFIDYEVIDLLRCVRQFQPVILVTNASTYLEVELRELDLVGLFDEIVNSARIGSAKPNSGIFLIAAKCAGFSPDRCLFIDDREENIAAATALGMTGHVYRNAASLREAFATLEVDPFP